MTVILDQSDLLNDNVYFTSKLFSLERSLLNDLLKIRIIIILS